MYKMKTQKNTYIFTNYINNNNNTKYITISELNVHDNYLTKIYSLLLSLLNAKGINAWHVYRHTV